MIMELKELKTLACRTGSLTCCLLGAFAFLCTLAAGAQPDGARYFLPKTALRISVMVEKTTYQPGDFAPFAQRYLRVADVSQEPSVGNRIIDIVQTPVPVADTAKAYTVHFDPRSVAARVTLAEDGRLLGLNVDDAYDADIPAEFVAARRPADVNPRQYMSEEILSCGSTAKMAELTAHEIYDLRENRTLLIKGQADFMPQDGRQMQIMLDELDKQDRALSSLFLGTTRCDTTEHLLWITPESPIARQTLFRLSQLRGLVEPDDLSGAPYYIQVENITEQPTDDPAAKKKAPKPTTSDIWVNMPGRLRATIYEGIEAVSTAEHPAPQFGQTLLLSSNLFNKRYTTRLWLNPLTGGVDRLDADQPK